MRIFFVAALLAGILAAQPLPLSSPEREGFSPERLKRLHDSFDQITKAGQKAGAITLIARNGKIADWRAYGHRDLEGRLPMEKDTICKVWSMTKVLTSVAALMLIEEGKIELDDPVEKFAPELKQLKVFKGGTAESPELVPAIGTMTVKHLLTHTSGFTYGSGGGPMAKIMGNAKVFEVDTLKAFIERLGTVPLVANPGEKYEYGVNTDVLGYVVQVASDMPFDRFVQTRILDPLKMQDTFFDVPAAKRHRLAKTYSLKDGKLVEQKDELAYRGVPFGGMGLYSTIGDYLRFGQMLLNGGQLDGARLLSRKTVELMMANHLNHMPRQTISGSESEGFGLGGSVRIDLAKGGRLGSVGEFGWTGAATTYFRLDPKEKTVSLMFMQHLPHDSATMRKFSTLFYQAIAD